MSINAQTDSERRDQLPCRGHQIRTQIPGPVTSWLGDNVLILCSSRTPKLPIWGLPRGLMCLEGCFPLTHQRAVSAGFGVRETQVLSLSLTLPSCAPRGKSPPLGLSFLVSTQDQKSSITFTAPVTQERVILANQVNKPICRHQRTKKINSQVR